MVNLKEFETIIDRTKNNPLFDEYKEIADNIRVYEERLLKVESTKSKFSEKVFKKVSGEYAASIKKYSKKIGPLKEKLVSEMEDFSGKMKHLSTLKDQVTEKMEELELRYIAGEIDEDNYNQQKAEFGPQLNTLNEKFDLLSNNLTVYSAFLGEGTTLSESGDDEGDDEIEPESQEMDTDDEADSEEVAPVEGAKEDLDSWQETSEDSEQEITDDKESEQDGLAPEASDGMNEDEEAGDLDRTIEESYEDEFPAETKSADENTPAEIQRDSLKPCIIIIEGDSEQAEFFLTSDVLTIGRGPDNDIQLANDTSVSRHHSRISFENGEYIITDLDSSNGTFVNGERVTQIALSESDEISIGQTLLMFKLRPE